MRVRFQLFDVDYILKDKKPILRLFGKTEDGKSITIFYEGFFPYFFVLPREGRMEELKRYLEKNFSNNLVKLEECERFLSIGFNERPVKLLKITLNNPAITPSIRDSLKKKRFVKEVFEADIPFKYRFMADHDIAGMRWYEIEGNGVNTNTVKTERKMTATSIKEVEKEGNAPLKFLSLDIEVRCEEGLPDPKKDQIILISLVFHPPFNGKEAIVLAARKMRYRDWIYSFSSEKEMLEEFLRIIERYDPDIILGYNINNFDLPFLDARLRENKLPRTLGRCSQKFMMSKKIANRFKNTVPGRIIVDVYELIKEAVVKFGLFKGLKRYSLSDVSKLILGEGKIDITLKDINTHWLDNGEKLEKLLQYSKKDAELPLRILLKERLLDKFIEISKVSGILLQDSISGGESTRIENLLLKEFNKRGFIIPCKPDSDEITKRNMERKERGLKGAFVLKPDVGLHEKCVVYLDFKSMYPSIIKAYNICPTTLLTQRKDVEFLETPNGARFVSEKVRKGIIPQILTYLLETRDKIKKEMKAAQDPEKRRYLYAKQYAFKTIANAFYGYLGYIRAKLYILDIANAITSTGRETIKLTKKIVESKTPYKVVYADTDSVMVKLDTEDLEEAFKIGKELSQLINEEIKHLQIKIESVFKTLLILSKKRYAGWSFEPVEGGWRESLVTKGIETVRRDWCDLVSETLEEVLNAILKEKNVDKAVKIVKEKVEKIKTGKMNIQKLVITKSISKSLGSYKGIQPHVELVKKMRARDPSSAPSIGDRVGFVIIKGPQMLSKRAEDPNYVLEHNLKIDDKYYIESQLLPPLERVFEALNVSKSELLSTGKQLGIFDIVKNVTHEKVFEEVLPEVDGFVCNNCGNIMRRPPLSGKCNYCNGEIVFYKGDKRSRLFNPLLNSR